jgi:hypothetical protein
MTGRRPWGDDGRVDYQVGLTQAGSRPTAVIVASTTWQDFPALRVRLLGEVWDCLRAGGISRGCLLRAAEGGRRTLVRSRYRPQACG